MSLRAAVTGSFRPKRPAGGSESTGLLEWKRPLDGHPAASDGVMEKQPQPRGGAGRQVPRCHFGTFANWYISVVSKTRQAGLILEEVHSVRMIVGASLRARH